MATLPFSSCQGKKMQKERGKEYITKNMIILRIFEFACDYYLLQALPYVALLILMLFFIYAVVGMQVYMHTETYKHTQ